MAKWFKFNKWTDFWSYDDNFNEIPLHMKFHWKKKTQTHTTTLRFNGNDDGKPNEINIYILHLLQNNSHLQFSNYFSFFLISFSPSFIHSVNNFQFSKEWMRFIKTVYFDGWNWSGFTFQSLSFFLPFSLFHSFTKCVQCDIMISRPNCHLPNISIKPTIQISVHRKLKWLKARYFNCLCMPFKGEKRYAKHYGVYNQVRWCCVARIHKTH